jgi:hypothetical protein
MVTFENIKSRVESGYMTYDELVGLCKKYEDRLDTMVWGPERYEREMELRDMENWTLDLCNTSEIY